MDYCMCVYGAKNSDRQIKNLPIPTESQFAKHSRYTVVYRLELHVQYITQLRPQATHVTLKN